MTPFSSVVKYLHEFQHANSLQAKSDFWKAKYDHEATKKARATAIAAKKTARKSKKKTTASDLLKLDDTSESEVALDSLGLLFNNLIDTDYYQDDTGARQAVEEEVTIISSDSHLYQGRNLDG